MIRILYQVGNRRNSSPTLEVGVFLLEEDKRILKNRIVYLFDEIIADEINRYDSCGDDPDLAQNMIQQLLEFIEKHYFDIPRKKIIKIISHRLEEIREIDNSSIILGYSPEKILEGFLIKLAEFYDYKLSPHFLSPL